jgi:hypothetical protein
MLLSTGCVVRHTLSREDFISGTRAPLLLAVIGIITKYIVSSSLRTLRISMVREECFEGGTPVLRKFPYTVIVGNDTWVR